jgi:hypothetical protein
MLWYAGERWRWVGTVAAVVCLLAAVASSMWVRLLGLAVASGAALTFSLMVSSSRALLVPGLSTGVRVGLGTAGERVAAAALLMFLGTVIALVWLRVPARTPDPARTPKRGKGTASLVLAVLGLFLPVLAAPAVGLGQLARDDDRLSAGRVRSRALGTAGIVLGAVALTLWGVGLTLAMFLAKPTFTSLR